ncbi:MAG: hypothetical protein ISS70_16770 [Phycisphaerae bacterium]|nr:hypothetical protein [Phycisphaerae bacterium]
MTQQTISETLFESYCQKHAICHSRIPTESDKRTPDYEIILKENLVISEVKQFDPTQEEVHLQKQLEEHGSTEVFGGKPGQRASQKIIDGTKQLRLLAKDKYPTLLILYNNVPITNRHVDPYAIKTAMYGLEEVVFAVPEETSVAPWVSDRRFGGRRRVTPSHNTTLSAVAVLYVNHNVGTPYLHIFHNIYAALPVNPEWLRNPETQHFKLEAKERDKKQFQEWIKV